MLFFSLHPSFHLISMRSFVILESLSFGLNFANDKFQRDMLLCCPTLTLIHPMLPPQGSNQTRMLEEKKGVCENEGCGNTINGQSFVRIESYTASTLVAHTLSQLYNFFLPYQQEAPLSFFAILPSIGPTFLLTLTDESLRCFFEE